LSLFSLLWAFPSGSSAKPNISYLLSLFPLFTSGQAVTEPGRAGSPPCSSLTAVLQELGMSMAEGFDLLQLSLPTPQGFTRNFRNHANRLKQ